MIESDSNHYQIVEKSLAGNRAVDEQTFDSLTILSERLEHLKNVDKIFYGVTFSPQVMELKARNRAVAVG
ncbi:MAG: hypothetical protein OEW48_04950 [Phycisphaerae bacterium]|nr:hypothetical protein [Phycisphaerae bacterium]